MVKIVRAFLLKSKFLKTVEELSMGQSFTRKPGLFSFDKNIDFGIQKWCTYLVALREHVYHFFLPPPLPPPLLC